MAELGSEDTQVEGQSFGLPSGFSWGEDAGDLVAFDSNGNVALRYDESAGTNGEWAVEELSVEISFHLPEATEGDEAPSNRTIAIDPDEGVILVPEEV